MERFFALSLDLLCIAGFDGYFKLLNEAWERALGFSREELLAKPFLDFVHPDDREATSAEAAKLAQGQEVLHFENRYRRKDGSYVWLSWTARPFAKEKSLYCVARDVTERKRAEETLWQAHAELETKVQERTGALAQANQSLQAEIAERARTEEAIKELSTPVLQVRDGLLIVPLIGSIDAWRAKQLTEQVLRTIRRNRARVVVIDVTGVPTLDTFVANHLIQTVEASRLLGAEMIVTGISTAIAQTLVALGIDFGKLKTAGDLQSGIEQAERLVELARPTADDRGSPQGG